MGAWEASVGGAGTGVGGLPGCPSLEVALLVLKSLPQRKDYIHIAKHLALGSLTPVCLLEPLPSWLPSSWAEQWSVSLKYTLEKSTW